MIFAREISDPLTSLVKRIDEATIKNHDAKMGSFVVFCTDQEDMEAKLKDLAKKEKLQEIVLTIDNPAGPRGFKISKAADVTVVLYTQHAIKANFAFHQGELDEKQIEKIITGLGTILPERKAEKPTSS
jgi:hypothetical protein